MTLLLPVVAALSAILILPGSSFFFDVIPKAIVILLGAALVFVLPRRWPAGLLKSKPLRYFTIIAAAQTVLILVTTLTSPHRQLSFLGSTWRRSGAITEIAVLVLAVAAAFEFASNPSARRTFLRITVAASIPISIYGILQYFGIDPILTAAGYHFGEGKFMIVRPPATLGHAAYFATYSLFAAFGGRALADEESSPSWKLAATVAAISALSAIVLSGTRAALLGFAIGAIFMNFRDPARARALFSRPTMTAISASAVLFLAFYISIAGQSLRARVFWSSEDRYGGSRLLLWRDSFRMAPDHLLLGYGPETFPIEFPQHQSIDLARQFPDFYHESAHNIFLDALTAKGIFGFAALAALVILCLARARGRGAAPCAASIVGAFVAMLVAQQFTTFTLPTELYFYLCAALILSEIKSQPLAAVSPSRRPWWPAVFAIPFLGMAIYLATGDALLATARRALDRNDPDRAWQFQERARAWNMTSDVYFSRRYFQITGAQLDTTSRQRLWAYAMASATRAPQTADDRQNALISLAALQSPSGDAPTVERTLRAAVAAAPNWYKSHWLLAQVLALEGRTAEARDEAQAAVDRGGGRHPEVLATFDRLR
jgi:O-antigen ligase